MNIIESLREYQIEKSLTSVELAKLLAIELDTLVNWYEGESKPNTTERYRIIKLIDGENLDEHIDEENFSDYTINN